MVRDALLQRFDVGQYFLAVGRQVRPVVSAIDWIDPTTVPAVVCGELVGKEWPDLQGKQREAAFKVEVEWSSTTFAVTQANRSPLSRILVLHAASDRVNPSNPSAAT